MSEEVAQSDGDPNTQTEEDQSEAHHEVETDDLQSEDPPENEDPQYPEPQQEESSPVENDLIKVSQILDDNERHVVDRLSMLNSFLGNETKVLKETHMKDYDRLDYLRKFMDSACALCQVYATEIQKYEEAMKGLSSALGTMVTTVNNKLTNEGLLSWLTSPPAPSSDFDETEKEKALLSEAAEKRSQVATIHRDYVKAQETATTLEAESIDAEKEAEVAARRAEEARVAAEEARKAAEAKRIADEQATRKSEEAKRKKDEEERRQREEEAQKRKEETRMAGSPEEMERRRKEAERKNPKNWPSWVYSVDPGDIDIALGCVMRVLPGAASREQITCERIEQVQGPLRLGDNEELVSNIVCLKADSEINPEESFSISFPHCAPRNVPSREPVVKMLQRDGSWTELPTSDVTFEDIKECKFVEARTKRLGSFAVVTRYKREQFTIVKKGVKVIPPVDTRVCLAFKPSAVKVSSNLTMEIQPIDLSAVSDLKHRQPGCEDLLAASPIINMKTAVRRFNKPVTVTIPVPPNPNKTKRPQTAGGDRSAKGGTPQKARPMSAFMSSYTKEEEADDQLSLLHKDDKGVWSVVSGITLTQAKNKDLVCFDITSPINKFMILRTKVGTTSLEAEKIISSLETSLNRSIVQVILRQKNEDPSETILQCVNVSKSERYQRNLSEAGYDLGPPPSLEISVREGQEMKLGFRGNLRDMERRDDMRIVYNSHIQATMEFKVKELDVFAQKSFDSYRGFVRVYADGLVPGTAAKEDDKKPNKDVLLTELLMSLPKPEPEKPKPIVTRAPVTVRSDGLIDNDLLRHLAAEIGDEWKKVAQHLNIKRVRIQAIIRNNVNTDTEQSIYEMLVTWAKKVPRSVNKVELLCGALQACGRNDMVEELRDREDDARRQRVQSARDSNLRQAFVKVAQNAHVVSDWRYLGRQLRLGEADLQEVERNHEGLRERCYNGLIKWKEVAGEAATVERLIKILRVCKWHHVAEQVKFIVS